MPRWSRSGICAGLHETNADTLNGGTELKYWVVILLYSTTVTDFKGL